MQRPWPKKAIPLACKEKKKKKARVNEAGPKRRIEFDKEEIKMTRTKKKKKKKKKNP
jgi:hypothetical protein